MIVAETLSSNPFSRFCFLFAPAVCIAADAIFEVNLSSIKAIFRSTNLFSRASFNKYTFCVMCASSLFSCFGSPITISTTLSFCTNSTKRCINRFEATVSSPKANIFASSLNAIPVRFNPKSRARIFDIVQRYSNSSFKRMHL